MWSKAYHSITMCAELSSDQIPIDGFRFAELQ